VRRLNAGHLLLLSCTGVHRRRASGAINEAIIASRLQTFRKPAISVPKRARRTRVAALADDFLLHGGEGVL